MPASDRVTIPQIGEIPVRCADRAVAGWKAESYGGPLPPPGERVIGQHLKSSVGVALSALVLTLVVSGCTDSESGSRDGLKPVPTRTTTAPASLVPATEPGGALAVNDFTVLPTFGCMKDVPARAIVTVGWSAPSATEVSLSLDGQKLPVGIQDELPFQVPAGGPARIGAAVVFACDGATSHTIDIEWTASGIPSASRTVTVIKESNDG